MEYIDVHGYKTYDEQIEILRGRGLIIDDIEQAKEILEIDNYYNVINGYKDLFCCLNDDGEEQFIDGTTFNEIYALYEFDRELRAIIFKYTLQIENTLRTLVAHIFSKYHGIENYLRYSNFDYIDYNSASKKKTNERAKHINELISNMQMDLARYTIKKDYINHYVVKHGYVPLWVLVNAISFSRLSTFYNLMKQKERVEISQHWNIQEIDLKSYIEVLAFFRNLCAHDDRIYNAKCKKQISDTNYHVLLNIPCHKNNQYIKGKNDIFSVIIVSKILLPPTEFNTMSNKINGILIRLSKKISVIPIEKIYEQMGLPNNWYLIKKI